MVKRLTRTTVERYQQLRIINILAKKARPGIKKSIRTASKEYIKTYSANGSFDEKLITKHKRDIENKLRRIYNTSIDVSSERMFSMFKKHDGRLLITKQDDLFMNESQEIDARAQVEQEKDNYVAETIAITALLISQTTEKNLLFYTSKAEEAGLDKADMDRLISENMNDISISRSKIIADTNVHDGVVWGNLETMGAIGVVTGTASRLRKEWITQLDELVRSNPPSAFDHRIVHGQRRKLKEPFNVSGEFLMYPGDSAGSPGNVISCRCVIGHVLA